MVSPGGGDGVSQQWLVSGPQEGGAPQVGRYTCLQQATQAACRAHVSGEDLPCFIRDLPGQSKENPAEGTAGSGFEAALAQALDSTDEEASPGSDHALETYVAAREHAEASARNAAEAFPNWQADVLYLARPTGDIMSPPPVSTTSTAPGIIPRTSLSHVGAVATAAVASSPCLPTPTTLLPSGTPLHSSAPQGYIRSGPTDAPEELPGTPPGDVQTSIVWGQPPPKPLPAGAPHHFQPPTLSKMERAAWLVPSAPQALHPDFAYIISGLSSHPLRRLADERPRDRAELMAMAAQADALNEAAVLPGRATTVESLGVAKRSSVAVNLAASHRGAGESALLPVSLIPWHGLSGPSHRQTRPPASHTDEGDVIVSWFSKNPRPSQSSSKDTKSSRIAKLLAGLKNRGPPPSAYAAAEWLGGGSVKRPRSALPTKTTSQAKRPRTAWQDYDREPEILPRSMGVTMDRTVRVSGSSALAGTNTSATSATSASEGAPVVVTVSNLPERMPRHIAEAEDRTAAYAVALAGSTRRKRRPKRVFVHSMAVADLDVSVQTDEQGVEHVVFGVPKDYLNVREETGGGGTRSRLARDVVLALKRWMMRPENWRHPYPDEATRTELAKDLGLTEAQVCNWFRNERKRLWLPMSRRAKAAVQAMRRSGHEEDARSDASDA